MPPATPHTTPRHTRSHPTLLAAITAASLLLSHATAQPAGDLRPVDTQPTPTTTRPDQRPAAISPVTFADDPLDLTAIGVRLQIPQGWTAQRYTRDAAPARTIDPEHSRRNSLALTWTPLAAEEASVTELSPGDATMVIRVQAPKAQDPATPLDALAQSLAQQLVNTAAASSGAGADAYVIFDQSADLTVAGRPAYRFYMRVPRRNHETGLVMGYTLLDLPGPEFLVLEYVSPEEHYVDSATRATYETVVAALAFLDTSEINQRRQALLLAAQRFIAQQTESAYVAALARLDGRLERLYNPAGTGSDSDDRERGVRRLNAWVGTRGEIDPAKSLNTYSETEREEGYLVRVSGRYFDRADDPTTGRRGLIIADFSSTYWMSKDRKREAWLSRMQVHAPGRTTDLFTEIGGRDNDNLSVWISTQGRPHRTIRPLYDPTAYMSQVEFYLFPDLLAAAALPTDFAFYAWQTSAETCRLIRDEAIPQSDGLAWKIRRTFGDTDETHTISYDANLRWLGTLREVGPVLTRGEPTTAERITTLWNAKNLPLQDPTASTRPGQRRPASTTPPRPTPRPNR